MLVNTFQELNARLMDQLTLMAYRTDFNERHRQVMRELHHSKYGKKWGKIHIPN